MEYKKDWGTYVAGGFALIAVISVLKMGLPRIIGHARTTFRHAENSLSMQTKIGGKIGFSDFCRTTLPPCRLNPFLFNGHLQTIWTAWKGKDIPVHYKRKVFENEDPAYAGAFTVDFVTRPYDGSDAELPPRTTYFTNEEFENIGSTDSRPMLVVLHGLKGGSQELYVLQVLENLVSEVGGWEACVINSRGCAMSKITTPILYNARATWDTRQTVKWLKKKFPNRPLFGLGFSLGGNILTNYVGEEGSKCLLKAVVVLSNPFNLEAGSLSLQRTFMGREVYSRAMGSSMKQLFHDHKEQASKNPRMNPEKVMNITYLHDFDRHVQGPTWGYPTEGAYYRDASSTDSVLGIRIPYLAIHAEDDPIAPNEALPIIEVQQSPYGVLCTTSLGGHVAWIELSGKRWFARASTAFFERMVREIDLEKPYEADDSFEEQMLHKNPLKPVFEPTRRKWHFRARE